MLKTVTYEVGNDGVAIITMNVPGSSANVMTADFRADLEQVIDRVVADPAVKAAVIASAKADFMAGGDIKAMV